jgi:hypothetical protein
MKTIGKLCILTAFLWSCSGTDTSPHESGKLVAIEVEEILHISDEFAEDFLFGRIVGISVDSDGYILVGDQSEKTIYHFSPDGDYLGNFGKEGAGPGEFGQFFSLSITPDDSLYIQDMMQSRVQAFGKSSDGTWRFGSTIPLRRGDGAFPSSLHKISDNAFLIHYMRGISPAGATGNKPFLQLSDRDGQKVGDKIIELEPFETHVIRTDNQVMAISIPHTYSMPYTVSRNGHIYTGYSDNFLISRYDIHGNHELDISWPVEPLALTREEKDEAVSNFGDAAAEVRSRIPDIRPAFIRLLVADSGDLWVNRGRINDKESWYVFTGDGNPLYEINLPSKYSVNQIRHGNIYGTLRDDDDLQSILVFRYITDGSAEGFATVK